MSSNSELAVGGGTGVGAGAPTAPLSSGMAQVGVDAAGSAVAPLPVRVLTWLRSALAAESAHSWIIVAALALTSTALTLGLTADDHIQTLALRGKAEGIAGIERAPWDLFAYARDSETIGKLMDEGMAPWWTDKNAQIAFMRPLSSLTIWLDRELWPNRPVLMHLHSLVWFAVLLGLVGAIYRRSARTALVSGLALAIFAFDDARAMTVGWICNRNALVALVFGFGAMILHMRARRDNHRLSAWLAPFLMLLGLFSAEAALQVYGYLFAYALCLDKGSRMERARSLLPYLGVFVAWRVVYRVMGYGAFGSGLYIDPARDLLHFAKAALERMPLLLTAQFTGMFAETGDTLPVFMPAAMPLLIPVCVLSLVLLGWLLWPVVKSSAEIRFWTVGLVLATVPVCGVSPTDRVLTATSLGAAGLLAAFLVAIVDRTYAARNKWTLGAAGFLAFVHLIAAPMLLPMRVKAVDHFEHLLAEADDSIPADSSVQSKTVVMLNPPVDPYAFYFPVYRAARGIARPQHVRWLATGVSELLITRMDSHTVKVRPTAGFLSNSSQWALRDPRVPAVLGEKVELTGVTFEVTGLTSDARPAEVTVRFDQSLDSSNFVWLQWGRRSYVPFDLPAVGQSVTIPAVNLMDAMF